MSNYNKYEKISLGFGALSLLFILMGVIHPGGYAYLGWGTMCMMQFIFLGLGWFDRRDDD